jgi:hypothetical protein
MGEGLMPFGVKKSGSKWSCYNKDTGKVYGKHDNKEKAIDQLAAIKSNYKEEFVRRIDLALGLLKEEEDEKERKLVDPQATTAPSVGAQKGVTKGGLNKQYSKRKRSKNPGIG